MPRSPSPRRSSKRSSARWPRRTAVRSRSGWYLSAQVQQVLVLNASYEPLNVCTVRRAHVLLYKGKAEVDRAARPAAPLGHRQLRLAPRDPARPLRPRARGRSSGRSPAGRSSPATAGAASTAGPPSGRLTLDHVVPRSKGGESIWENVVTACAPCNLRKGDRSARAGRHGAEDPAAPAAAGALHQARRAADPAALDAVPRRLGTSHRRGVDPSRDPV